MVKILVSEDDDDKLGEICSFLKSIGVLERDILTARTMAEFASKYDQDVGVCVIDIRIPAYDGAHADQNGLGILQHLESTSNGKVKLLAISAYPDEFEEIRPRFERQGCVLADYKNRDVWQNALRMLVLQSTAQTRFDFLIFTALRKERAPYLTVTELKGKPISVDGLMRYDVSIGDRVGSIIELPRMGLVDAAALAAKCIDRYAPEIVAMSGICAGFSGRAKMGQLLVTEVAYEYQTGKWTEDGFQAEPYQAVMSEFLRMKIRHLLEDENLIYELEEGWKATRPSSSSKPELVVFTSGSAVIADARYMEQVANHHRKVAGLDMEVFGLHRAAHLASKSPDVLCAKVVVDLADGDKNDDIHNYGCFVSSRFILKAMECYFDQQSNTS
jgi:nucleoside phosphorylase